MIKLILTDMDGTFLNSQGDFNRELFKQVKQMMTEKGVIFAPCTGKQSERVEEIFGEDAADFWILGDSASRIKRNGAVVYESLLENTNRPCHPARTGGNAARAYVDCLHERSRHDQK